MIGKPPSITQSDYRRSSGCKRGLISAHSSFACAALVTYGLNNGLLLAEPGAGGGCFAEPVRVLCLANLGDQFGLALP